MKILVCGLIGVMSVLSLISCNKSDSGTAANSCSTALLETDMTTLLAQASSEVDFSYVIERADGRRFSYNRGSSTLTTSYESASTSKLVTAAVILRLVQAGTLTLNDRPQDHITSWPLTNSDPLYTLTLKQLLSFTSGLMATEPACINLGASNFETCVVNIGNANANKTASPGTQFYYSSNHMQVAGLMAVKASGLSSWSQVFANFKTATGLFASSTYDLPSSTNPRLAGGMHWTAQDYMAFLKALSAGTLLNSTMMTQLLTDQTAAATITYSPTVEAMSEDWHYGLGLWHECQSSTYNCTPAVRVSSPGAYGAYPFWDRSKNYFGLVARQGTLGTYPKGIAIERTVRSKAEAWASCTNN